MNKYRKMIGIGIGMITLVQVALASEHGVGNGGLGLAHRDASGNIDQVEMLDYFEATTGLFASASSLNVPLHFNLFVDSDQAIQWAIRRANAVPNFKKVFLESLNDVEEMKNILPARVTIEPTNDAFPAFKRDGWEWVQVAKLNDESARLDIDRLLYSKMDTLNKAFLKVHEAVYLTVRRFTQQKDSKDARLIAAMLLSNDALDKDLLALTYSVIPEAAPKPLTGLSIHELCKTARRVSFKGTLSGGASGMDFKLEENGNFRNLLSINTGRSNVVSVSCSKLVERRAFQFSMNPSTQAGSFEIEIKVDGKTWFKANYPTHTAGDFGGFYL